jgi:hypothetical protein
MAAVNEQVIGQRGVHERNTCCCCREAAAQLWRSCGLREHHTLLVEHVTKRVHNCKRLIPCEGDACFEAQTTLAVRFGAVLDDGNDLLCR